MIEWITRNRTAAYLALNATLLLVVVLAAGIQHMPIARAAFVIGMILICSAPLLFLETINGRYALWAIFMAFYFCFFGALDLLTLLFGGAYPPDASESMSAAECGILLGGIAASAGYLFGATLGRSTRQVKSVTDWPAGTILFVGLLVWSVGIIAIVYFQVFAAPEKSNLSIKQGLAAMGPVLTFAVLLATLMQPLGVLILAYGYAKFRTLVWQVLIIAMMCGQIAVGFITDQKQVAMMGGLLVIVVKTLLDARLPKAWLAGAALFVIFIFPVFQAYRVEVTGERGLNREQALQKLAQVIEIAVNSRNKVTNADRLDRAPTFFERLSSKDNVELIFDHAGVDTPYLDGRSLVAIPLAFVPRLILPDKQDIAVGQVFAKVFLKADSDVYISLSCLGELYWNFGWAGVLLGMTLYGLLLGVIGARSDLSQSVSVTRLLVLGATAQLLCLGFGGSIATSWVSWLRSLAAIGILHLLLSRKRARSPPQGGARRRAHSQLLSSGPEQTRAVPVALSSRALSTRSQRFA